MSIERTLSILKPDAVGKHSIGKIIARFEENGLRPEAFAYHNCAMISPAVKSRLKPCLPVEQNWQLSLQPT